MKCTSMEEMGQTGVKEITLRLKKINPQNKKKIYTSTEQFSFFRFTT